MLIQKNAKITIRDNISTLDENLYFYRNDRNINVLFEIFNFNFEFLDGVKEEGNVVNIINPSLVFSEIPLFSSNLLYLILESFCAYSITMVSTQFSRLPSAIQSSTRQKVCPKTDSIICRKKSSGV